jgi:ankyrin repeat protein
LEKKIKLAKKHSQGISYQIWNNSLLHNSVKNNSFILYCVLSLLGARLDARNSKGKSVYIELLKILNYESGNLHMTNAFVKWWIMKVTDQHWLKLVKMTAERCLKNSLNHLIENKSNVNVWSNKNGSTALHFASEHNLQEAAHRLVSKKADVNAKNFKGNTPLHIAVQKSNIDIINFLIKNGANVNEENRRKQKPLKLVFVIFVTSYTFHKFYEVLKALIETNAEVSAKDDFNNTHLHAALKFDISNEEKEKCCKLLIQAGTDLSAKNDHGDTALHFGCQMWHQYHLEMLIGKGSQCE